MSYDKNDLPTTDRSARFAGSRQRETAPMQTWPYRLIAGREVREEVDLPAGAKLRVASAQTYVGGRGYVPKVFVWTSRPEKDEYTHLSADIVYDAQVFDAQVEQGLIVREADYEPRISREEAAHLHRRLGAAGYPSDEHYTLCDLRYEPRPGGTSFESLTQLTQAEAEDLETWLDDALTGSGGAGDGLPAGSASGAPDVVETETGARMELY